jgi:hypothetical protein
MSAPDCCPFARHFGKAALVVLLAAGLFVTVRSLQADDKSDDKADVKDKQPAAKPEAEQAASRDRPANAVVLFDGKDLSQWRKYEPGRGADGPAPWKVVDGAMEVGGGDVITKDKFRDMKLHLEFMPPSMPEASGQAKGNSGVFVMDNYEVQVLDSFGLPKLGVGDCAALYSKRVPDKNAAKPPAQWQTYDIEFTAPKFDAAGKKTTNARITVVWNGQKVHDNIELEGPLPGGTGEKPEGGGVRLQDHGNPVRYRNIWVVPLE